MKQIAINNLTLIFDASSRGTPKEQAQSVLQVINETLQDANLHVQPQILMSGVDNSDINEDFGDETE